MSEVVKDSAIKLFGRRISLTRNSEVSAIDSSSEPHEDFSDHSPLPSSSSPHEVTSTQHVKEPLSKELTSVKDDDEASQQTTEDLKSPTSFENPKTPSAERETSLLKSTKNGEQRDVSQDKAPKKPDKILPCPRCNSMDTKFCYYNNYNVNQPRHFCKKCQRYWTAGGTMRNVPVGAGRRKNKNSSCSSSTSSHYQVMVPDTLQTTNGLHSSVLTFGSDSPLCDSMSSVLSLTEKTSPNNVVLKGFHSPKQNKYVSNCREDSNGDDIDSSVGGGSVKASTSSDKKGNVISQDEESVDKIHHGFGFPPQFPFYFSSSTPWPYPMPPPAFYQPNYPMSLYPNPAYWGGFLPPPWSLPSILPQSSPNSGPNSPTLGKHSRDGDILFHSNSEKEKPGSENNNSVWIPKTLRIDDPSEAAKSSIWSTLGIKNESKGNSLNGGGIFKAFESKGGGDKNHVVEASSVLHANPAALSRSLVFHERT